MDATWTTRPTARFYPEDELNRDDTNWWGPNPAAVRAMAEAAGFRRVDVGHRYSATRRVARAVKRRLRRAMPLRESIWQGRAAFHARP